MSEPPADNSKLTQGLLDRALGNMADEFAENSKGAGAPLGNAVKSLVRTTEAIAVAVETVVKSPALIGQVWNSVRDKVTPALRERLAHLSPEEIQPPPISVAGPILEALRFTVDDDELRNMFVNLLAATMDPASTSNAHHSFVEIIKQLSPDEARILKYMGEDEEAGFQVANLQAYSKEGGFINIARNLTHLGKDAGVANQVNVPSYLDNLCRLGLCAIPNGITLDSSYDPLTNCPDFLPFIDTIKAMGRTPKFERRIIELTEYGRKFVTLCVIEKIDLKEVVSAGNGPT